MVVSAEWLLVKIASAQIASKAVNFLPARLLCAERNCLYTTFRNNNFPHVSEHPFGPSNLSNPHAHLKEAQWIRPLREMLKPTPAGVSAGFQSFVILSAAPLLQRGPPSDFQKELHFRPKSNLSLGRKYPIRPEMFPVLTLK